MMQFPLLKMQHYRVIVGKLLSTIQMTEVSKLFLQKILRWFDHRLDRGTQASRVTLLRRIFVAFTANSLLTVISISRTTTLLKTEMSVAVRSKERWQILWLGQN